MFQANLHRLVNLTLKRGIKKLGYGRYLSVSRYRTRKGLPPAPSASSLLTDEPDWSYPDGRPGCLNKGQTKRYIKDQEMGQTIVEFSKQFKACGKPAFNNK